MRIYFWNTAKFTRKSDYIEISPETKIEIVLKRQVNPAVAGQIEGIAEAVAKTSIIFYILIILKFSVLNQVLS